MDDMPGAFPAGPSYGSDYLPTDPVEAMRDGTAHRVPLIVGTNADEGKLFTRFLPLLPTTETDDRTRCWPIPTPARERITAAYPGYPEPAACIRLGGDFAFGTAAWQIAEAHSRHAPTYVYRYDYAPRTLSGRVWAPPTRWSCWRSSTPTAPGSARCSPRRATGGRRAGSATTSRVAGGNSAAPVCPARVGRSTTGGARGARVRPQDARRVRPRRRASPGVGGVQPRRSLTPIPCAVGTKVIA